MHQFHNILDNDTSNHYFLYRIKDMNYHYHDGQIYSKPIQ